MRGPGILAALLLLACSHAPQQQAADSPSDSDTCVTAADCKGMLPHLCRTCADGGAECSRWACESGLCMVAATCR
jgi:hypothetical protein